MTTRREKSVARRAVRGMLREGRAERLAKVGPLSLFADAVMICPGPTVGNVEITPQGRPLVHASAVVEYQRGVLAGRALTLTVRGPGFVWPVKLKPHQVDRARAFAAALEVAAGAPQ